MVFKLRKQHIPWAMAAGRAALGPVLIAGEACGWNGIALAGTVVTALLSDIFDGVLARRWRCDTAAVRLFDSMADMVFYLCAAVALWIGQRALWQHYAGWLMLLLALEAVRFALDFAKFSKPASYHSYLAKTWGLVMAVGVVTLFGTQGASPIFTVAMVLGVLCNLEGIAMSLLLPVWRRDVKTLMAAWQIRREILGLEGTGPAVRRSGLESNVSSTVAALIVLAVASPAFAIEPGRAAYSSGTAAVAQGTAGVLDTSSPTALVFKFNGSDGKPGQVSIDYKDMRSYEYRNEVTHHLGVLPAIAVGLLASRQRQHFFTLSYMDSAAVAQIAIFEVSKHDVAALQALLRARNPKICSGGAPVCGRIAAANNAGTGALPLSA